MTRTVNVGTIGHIDHGKTTLTAALIDVLGKDMASQVVVLDDAGVADARRKGLIIDDLDVYASPFGRRRSNPRKAARKARMLELQRRAFLGDQQPSKMP